MRSFFQRLETRAQEIRSLLCIGLDPHPADLPTPSAAGARDFCLRLIETTHDLALAYKPNAAFFEAWGPEGWAALESVVQAIPAGTLILLDAKRGDISSTAQAYARSAFETLGVDAITINPYLGQDSIQPFIADPQKGIFLLCKTSNSGAADLQDLLVSREPAARLGDADAGHQLADPPVLVPLYEYVARLAASWNQQDNIGLVVGATHPEALRRARLAAPDLWFLAPGVGAQGGDLEDALRAGLRADGLGMLVPVSRSIARAADPRAEAMALRQKIESRRSGIALVGQPGPPAADLFPGGEQLAGALLRLDCVQFGEFTLKSGRQSPIYIDLRRLVAEPRILAQVAEAFLPLLRGLRFDLLAGLPYAALPIATAISLRGGWPLIYPRKEVKDYGTRAPIEGVYAAGQRAVVIDDLITTGGSKLEAIEKLQAAGLEVSDVVVLIDRTGAIDFSTEYGYRLHAVFTLPQLLDHWERGGGVPRARLDAARRYLAAA